MAEGSVGIVLSGILYRGAQMKWSVLTWLLSIAAAASGAYAARNPTAPRPSAAAPNSDSPSFSSTASPATATRPTNARRRPPLCEPVAGAHLWRADDGSHETDRRHPERGGPAPGGRISGRPVAGLFAGGRCRQDAQSLRRQSAVPRRRGSRLERLGKRAGKPSLSIRVGGGAHGRFGSASAVEMGLRIPGRHVGVRTTRRGGRPRLRRHRHGIHLFTGRCIGLHLLVLSGGGGRSQRDDSGADQDRERSPFRGVLRRPESRRLCHRRAERQADLEDPRRGEFRRACDGGSQPVPGTPLCPDLGLGGISGTCPRLSLLHGRRQPERARR